MKNYRFWFSIQLYMKNYQSGELLRVTHSWIQLLVNLASVVIHNSKRFLILNVLNLVGRVPLFAFVSVSWFWNFFSWVFRESISFFLWLILFKDFHWLATRETLTKQRYINTSQIAYSIPNRFQQLLEGSSELRSRLLPATLTDSQSLPTNVTHSHPFSKKNNTLPLIFWQKRLAPTHFSRKITHSHHFPKKIIHSHPFLTKTTHSYPFFDNNDPLSPIFQGKRIIPTHFLTKATHSHPFFDKNDTLLSIFQQKRPTPT